MGRAERNNDKKLQREEELIAQEKALGLGLWSECVSVTLRTPLNEPFKSCGITHWVVTLVDSSIDSIIKRCEIHAPGSGAKVRDLLLKGKKNV